MKRNNKIIVVVFLLCLTSILSYGFGRSSVERQANRNKIEDFLQTNESNSSLDIISNIDSLIEKIEKDFLGEVDEEKLETGIYKGIVSSLDDPYSVYYNDEEFKSLLEDTQGEFGGIGIQVTASETGYIEVVSPIKDTPGDRAGIQTGDFITHINGVQFGAQDLDQAVKTMRGEPGHDVTITILRGVGKDQEVFDLTITREIISVQSVHYEMLDDNVAYILLTGFQENTDEDFIAALEELEAKGAQSLVLDLRNNPGGLLDVVINIADYLLDEGVVISVRYKDESNNEELKAKDGKTDIPMTVLINGGSASASEVLAGALQDHGRAKLVGETSFGKGVIQQIYPIFNNGEQEGMKLTIAEFYTPDGNKIHDNGIKPDYEVGLPEDISHIGTDNIENDTQLQKAIELLK